VRRLSTISCAAVAACLGLAASSLTSLLGATGPQVTPPTPQEACVRPEPGRAISEPAELRSHDGILETDLRILDQKLANGAIRYCYLTPDGKPSPTLRVRPGDQLVIHFKNDLVDLDTATPAIDRPLAGAPICTTRKQADVCESGAMTPISTNLHFHG
jgi:FtsP/CotA-like multicopper oxidase with cupredoxin domain